MPAKGFPLAAGWAGLALLFLAGCGSDGQDAGGPAAPAGVVAERALPVVVVAAERTVFEEVVQMTGTIEAPHDATLSAESAGTLRTLLPLGAVVRRGQVVAQVDPALADAALAQAEAGLGAAQAQLDLAEDQFRRQEPLYRDSIISALEFEIVRAQRASAQAQVAQARAALAQAREHRARTRIVAPFDGTVEAHLADRGAQVAPGAPVIRLISASTVTVRAGVPERYAGDIGVGSTVVVTPQAYDLPPRRAVVVFAGQSIDPQSRTFPIEVSLDNREGRLKPQMMVRLEVTRRTLAEVIAIPMSAVVRDERGTSVFVVEGGEVPVARLRPVTLGPTGGGRVVISQGLEPGATVVIQGQTTLADGDAVQIAGGRRGDALGLHTTVR